MPDVLFYPLRPEFVESTYLLYLATKNPFYQHVGLQIIDSINLHTRVTCGFATVHNVLDKSLEDRMESFFLSETCKYLYLLFDVSNPVNKNYHRLLFSTEGHTFPIISRFRRKDSAKYESNIKKRPQESNDDFVILDNDRLSAGRYGYNTTLFCDGNNPSLFRLRPPLDEWRFGQYMSMVGLGSGSSIDGNCA